ncbi:MAG: tryptophanase [Bdellovibrionales bacterium]|nr:tryptophanase [Bdellovibrionales bacterium]
MSYKPKTVIEPFKIKMVEPLPLLSEEQRATAIKKAHYNLFSLDAQDVTFDLLTDSGTSAMSATQWAGIMIGDESYAGSQSFRKFESTVQEITGLKHVIPTHQGRSAEDLLMKALICEGDAVLGNTHFDTTRANILSAGARAIDLPSPEVKNTGAFAPFKGNMDLDRLAAQLEKNNSSIALVIMTVTNNSIGGQPVSMENLKAVRLLTQKYNIPLFLDVARFAENAYFIKLREPGYEEKSVPSIVQEMFSYADGALMSAKKDAFANIGGFLAVNSDSLAEKVRSLMVITEGFPTYGGLAGRDMEALAIGLREIQEEHYLQYRLRSVAYFGEGIEQAGIPVVKPFGGHAIYLDAAKALPHIPPHEFPGQALSVALYERIGIRGVEIGTVMMGYRDPESGEEHPADLELVRLAMPRRVYTQSHVDYMIEMLSQLVPELPALKGYKFTYQPPLLRHFTARFAPL